MSSVTSQSELTTKEIVEQAIQDYHMSILPYLTNSNDGYSETPIGAMQLFDDDTAPSGWLITDGTVYNINDYPFLANHIERVHGSKNYYGGDGTTTFAVPNWQGEFFRASGTNSHTGQGNGAAVGEHQDGTEHANILLNANKNLEMPTTASDKVDAVKDAKHPNYANNNIWVGEDSWDMPSTYTSRPTNTSLLCCIKAVPAGVNYSSEEQEIGTWIDGKPIYQKTLHLNPSDFIGSWPFKYYSLASLNMDKVICAPKGCFYYSNSTWVNIPDIEVAASGFNDNYTCTWTVRANSTDRELLLCAQTDAQSRIGEMYITIQYTKTTD